MEGDTHQQRRLACHCSYWRDIVLVEEWGHHHVELPLGVVGNIDDDKEVSSGSRSQTG